MSAFYPLLTLISIALFAWLARRLALARNRNVWGWALVGAVLPPAIFILYALAPLEPEEPVDDAADD